MRVTEREGPELAIFLFRDHGGLLKTIGRANKAVQSEIGNPLTASKMTRHQLAAALYAPLRVVLSRMSKARAFSNMTSHLPSLANMAMSERRRWDALWMSPWKPRCARQLISGRDEAAADARRGVPP